MRGWPHAPSREVNVAGTYMVTGATLNKKRLFQTAEELSMLHDLLLNTAAEFEWNLQAWAVFPNHYHFIGFSPHENALAKFTRKLHGLSAIQLNRAQSTPGRQVWFQYWQTLLTFEKSYLARLHYVHANAVKHGLVRNPEDYEWCSAKWFISQGDPAFVATVQSFPIDRVNVRDDFD